MLELLFQGLCEWIYGLTLESWEFFSAHLLELMSLDFAYLKLHIPVIDDISQILLAVGWALLIGNLVFQALKSMAAGLGFEGEDPKFLFARTFIFAFLLLASPQICGIGLNLTASIIALLEIPDAVQVTLVDDSVFGSLVAAWLLIIIFNLIIMFKVLGLILALAERYVVLAVLTVTAPLAFSMGGSRSTSEIFSGWCRMFGSMCLAMTTSVIFFKMLLSVLATVPTVSNVIPWMALVITVANVARKADSIIMRIGLNPSFAGAGGVRIPGALTYVIVREAASRFGRVFSRAGGANTHASGGGRNNPPPGGFWRPRPDGGPSGNGGGFTPSPDQMGGGPHSRMGSVQTQGAKTQSAPFQAGPIQSEAGIQSPQKSTSLTAGTRQGADKDMTDGFPNTAVGQMRQNRAAAQSGSRQSSVPHNVHRAPSLLTPPDKVAGAEAVRENHSEGITVGLDKSVLMATSVVSAGTRRSSGVGSKEQSVKMAGLQHGLAGTGANMSPRHIGAADAQRNPTSKHGSADKNENPARQESGIISTMSGIPATKASGRIPDHGTAGMAGRFSMRPAQQYVQEPHATESKISGQTHTSPVLQQASPVQQESQRQFGGVLPVVDGAVGEHRPGTAGTRQSYVAGQISPVLQPGGGNASSPGAGPLVPRQSGPAQQENQRGSASSMPSVSGSTVHKHPGLAGTATERHPPVQTRKAARGQTAKDMQSDSFRNAAKTTPTPPISGSSSKSDPRNRTSRRLRGQNHGRKQ